MFVSKTNKALIIITATIALILGALVNSQHTTQQIDSSALLNAQLLKNDQSIHQAGDSLGKLTLINFWASWCAPCRDEMPMFEAVYQQSKQQGFQIIGIAIDSIEKAQPMLDSMGITYPILYAEQTGMDLLQISGNPQGLLPYSLLVNSKGHVLEQKFGKISLFDMETWLKNYL